jgi:hypothetical protein
MIKRSFSLEFPKLLLPFVLALATGCSSESPNPDPEPAPPTNPWNGQTYLLDVAARNWAEPRGIGQEIDDFVPNFLFRVDGESPDSFRVTMATAHEDGMQDACNKTSELDATATLPDTMIGPAEFPLHIQHVNEPIAVDGTIYNFTIKDVLPDGDTLSTTGELTATMDFRELYPLFTLLVDPTPESVCSAFEMSYSAPCEPCPNDGEAFCLTVKANTLGAVPYDGTIEPVDSVDPSCIPTSDPQP